MCSWRSLLSLTFPTDTILRMLWFLAFTSDMCYYHRSRVHRVCNQFGYTIVLMHTQYLHLHTKSSERVNHGGNERETWKAAQVS
jgi:hypothetical protein